MRFDAVAFVVFACAAGACSTSDTSSTSDGGSDGGPPPMIHASDYDQHCSAPSDCAIVDEGDVCGCRGCGNAAIAKADLPKYEADVAALMKQCPGGKGALCPAACIFSQATCIASTCGVCHSTGCGADASSDAARD